MKKGILNPIITTLILMIAVFGAAWLFVQFHSVEVISTKECTVIDRIQTNTIRDRLLVECSHGKEILPISTIHDYYDGQRVTVEELNTGKWRVE